MANVTFDFNGHQLIFADCVNDIPHDIPLILFQPIDTIVGRKGKIILSFRNETISDWLIRFLFKTQRYAANQIKAEVVKIYASIPNSNESCSDSSHWVLINSVSWFNSFARFKELGYRKFVILADQNINSWRNAVLFGNERVVFLPNYKALYSSITDFVKENYTNVPLDATGHLSQAFNFNTKDLKNYFSFSVYRDPLSRFVSLYKWINRNAKSEYLDFQYDWVKPVEYLSGEPFSVASLASIVVKIPDTHSDNHFVSQYRKTHFNNKRLVANIYGIKQTAQLQSDLSDFLGREVKIPLSNQSEKFLVSLPAQYQELILERYACDYHFCGDAGLHV